MFSISIHLISLPFRGFNCFAIKTTKFNSNFEYWFKNPDYLEETEAKAFLAGSYNFQNVEIEVFTHSDE